MGISRLSRVLGRPVGFSTGCFHGTMDLYSGEAVRLIRGYGYGVIEIRLDDINRIKELEAILPMIKRFDIKILHLPGNVSYDNTKETRLFLGWCSEFYQKIGASLAIIHPETVTDFKLFKCLPMQVAVENMDVSKSNFYWPKEFVELFADNPELKLVLDVSHCYGHDRTLKLVGEYTNLFADRIAEIHLSGSGVGGDHLSLYKSGQVNLVKSIPVGSCPIVIEGPLSNPEKDMQRELRFISAVYGC